MSITAIIVTYNRRKDLERCIDAVLNQTIPPNNLLIVNNASIDDTEDFIHQTFGSFVEAFRSEQDVVLKAQAITLTSIYLINKASNTGGAGGFYAGLKAAHQHLNSDLYWMMDDDGYPSKECLERQISYIDKYDYVMPVSINIDNPIEMSWPTVMRNGNKTLSYKKIRDSWGDIMNYVYPFNGSLLSKRLVDEVGYVNKDFFIWGDEYEHYWRCKREGFSPITVIAAVFYHPANKMSFIPIMNGLINVPFSDSKLRMVCLARNYTYIYWNYGFRYKIILKFFLYSWLFIFTHRFDIAGYKLYLLSVWDGLRGNFNRHLNYLK